MASLSLSSLSVIDNEPNTTMTKFSSFPGELQRMILKQAADEPEIIMVKVIRRIQQNKTRSCKTIRGVVVQAGFTSTYKTTSVPVDLDRAEFTRADGHQYQRSGLAFANKQTRSVYLESKPAFLILNNGQKIFFNPDTDKIYFPDITRFNLHQRRQRLRPKMNYILGGTRISTVVFDEQTDEERVDDFFPPIVGTFLSAIERIEQGVTFLNERTLHWKEEVQEEHEKLVYEVKRADVCLNTNARLSNMVNGVRFASGVEILRFPNLEGGA
jgi:hypothetical protein